MGLASIRLWALVLAVLPMACLVTDKIEFQLIPPRLTPFSPSGTLVLQLSEPHADCQVLGYPDGHTLFIAEFHNAQAADSPLAFRFSVDGSRPMTDESRIGETNGRVGFCVERLPPGCYVIELYASHEFMPIRDGEFTPVEEDDLHRVVWYLGVEGTEQDPLENPLFDECAEEAPPPLGQMDVVDGGLPQ